MILFRGSSSIALTGGAVRESFRAFQRGVFGYYPLFFVRLDSSATDGFKHKAMGSCTVRRGIRVVIAA